MKFNLEMGISVQTEQLAEWSYILNDFAYTALKEKCEETNRDLRNEGCDDGYQVFRGNEMNNFIGNLALTLRRNNLEKFPL